jgi:glycosyltransferase involved in cell wall biosynthesis
VSEATRVLQLITELRPGGAERIVYELARGLPSDRYTVEVCSLRPATGAVAGWLREAGIGVHSLEITHKLDLGAIGRLRALLRRGAFGILHTHLFHANMVGRLAARHGVPPIVLGTIHIAERRFRPWHFWLDRMTLGPHGVEVCVSQAVRDFTRERTRLAPERFRVISNGVDLSRFDRYADADVRKTAARELRSEFGFSPETRVAVAVGRLEDQKGYPDLLEAWARLRNDARLAVSGAALIVGGEGRERPALEAQIRRLGLGNRVRLPGHREDIPKFLAGADLLAFSSHYEGFGLALVEAMAAGLPVVATAVDSVPEVLGDSPAGHLVPPRDPDALAHELAETIALAPDRRESLAVLARARAQTFSLPKMLNAYAELYDELLGKR